MRNGFTDPDLNQFLADYVRCALWSSTDDNGIPLDRDYSPEDFSDEAWEQMRSDCEAFYLAYESAVLTNVSRAGHDLWLTRNRHGAGFWDGDWSEPYDKILTDAAHKMGECDLYVGDDEKIHIM
jgi:hypothetical protein